MTNTNETHPSIDSFMVAVGNLLREFGAGPIWSIDQDSDGQLVINTGLTYTKGDGVKVMEGDSHV